MGFKLIPGLYYWRSQWADVQVAQRNSSLAQLHAKSSLGLVPQFLGSAAKEGQSSPGPCFTHLHKQQNEWHALILFWGFPCSQHLVHILTAHRKWAERSGCALHSRARSTAQQTNVGWAPRILSPPMMTRVKGPETQGNLATKKSLKIQSARCLLAYIIRKSSSAGFLLRDMNWGFQRS